MGTAPAHSTFTRGSVDYPPVECKPDSLAFFCPACGDVWARLPVELPDDSFTPFFILTAACRNHSTSYWQCPGSLRTGTSETLQQTFPLPVLQWETQRHIDWYDNWMGD